MATSNNQFRNDIKNQYGKAMMLLEVRNSGISDAQDYLKDDHMMIVFAPTPEGQRLRDTALYAFYHRHHIDLQDDNMQDFSLDRNENLTAKAGSLLYAPKYHTLILPLRDDLTKEEYPEIDVLREMGHAIKWREKPDQKKSGRRSQKLSEYERNQQPGEKEGEPAKRFEQPIHYVRCMATESEAHLMNYLEAREKLTDIDKDLQIMTEATEAHSATEKDVPLVMLTLKPEKPEDGKPPHVVIDPELIARVKAGIAPDETLNRPSH